MTWFPWIMAGSIIAGLIAVAWWVWKNQAPPTLSDMRDALKGKRKK